MISALPASGVTKLVHDAAGRQMEASQPDRPEVDLPQPIIHCLETHVLFRQQVAHVDPLMVPANAAVPAHPADLEVTRILERRKPARIGPRRRRVAARRSRIIQGFVRSDVIVPSPKAIQGALLRLERRLRPAGRSA